MELIKKIIHTISIFIYVLIIIYGIIWLPSILGYKPLIVLSESMYPTYSKGSIIYVKEVAKDNIKVGDIITFKNRDNNLISHRVVEINSGKYTTKGDANNTNDALKIDYNDIVGKDIDINIRYLGYYVDYIQKNMFLLMFVVFILILEFLLNNSRNADIEKMGKENIK